MGRDSPPAPKVIHTQYYIITRISTVSITPNSATRYHSEATLYLDLCHIASGYEKY